MAYDPRCLSLLAWAFGAAGTTHTLASTRIQDVPNQGLLHLMPLPSTPSCSLETVLPGPARVRVVPARPRIDAYNATRWHGQATTSGPPCFRVKAPKNVVQCSQSAVAV
ncbi:hypothetical protein B0H17DRAFT_341962 [Mycena rosella]|uniref:Uncharacterized protein n=1 Tax=Mycena rosella TaxID=1033263 RepID=A0AAD7DRP0_MYCRO|nr:hypothetical protein B0H17DRAFT_341962 [Mycena rosella]